MDKQKQIEEMAKDMLEYAIKEYPTRESVFTETKLRETFYHVFLTYAETLYNAGCRKIPKNAVVLAKEEYKALKEQIEYWEYETKVARQELFEERKETAEKFAERLKEKFSETEHFLLSKANVKYTIDEICKEITEDKV